jgi:YesN/AraC family two-component response regulator
MDARVEKVVTRMKEEFRQDPSLSEMAHVVNLSQSRLRYLFKKEIGVAPGHYLRAFRLERAKELLETTFLSVKEIISSIGVNDQSHFIREFKKAYSFTPAQYRMSLATNTNVTENRRNLEGLLVLLVEDDRDTREIVGILLERAGANVTSIASSGKALVALERMRPHILIIDIGLPDEDGYALIRKARALLDQRGEKIPAVALTAYTSEEDRARALSAGFEIHMPKPPGPAQLIDVVARLTGRSEVSDPKSTLINRTAKTANKQ